MLKYPLVLNSNEKRYMHNSDTELIFPLRILPELRSFRGEKWQRIIDEALEKDAGIIEKVAITMVMVGIAGCLTCSPDSFRAIKGCTKCAKRALQKSKFSENELVKAYKDAKEKAKVYIENNHPEMSDLFFE